ncbi:peptidoglycan binding domain-containing protein [Kitasatospora paranensis]|uniref:Peptidoglycan binding domain-containing protein n=1 Tax=Kitasatospora paranensis TaxID=258053 RepID=A0ABW2G0B7_9ACTN
MSSRESDNAYQPRGGSAPRPGGRDASQGRRPADGADAYPSGTPPYGTGLPGAAAFAHGASGDPFGTASQPPIGGAGGPDDDVPKTETTLTTRVRINIPGSRPIPPVVVRSPVKTEEQAPEPGAPRHRADNGGPSPVLGVMDAGGAAAPPQLPSQWQEGRPGAGAPAPGGPATGAESESSSTGEWFRPRQKGQAPVPAGAPAGTPAGGQTAPQAAPQAAAPAAAPTNPQAAPGRPAGTRPLVGEQRSAPRPSGAPASPFATAPESAPQDPFAPRDPLAAPHDPFAPQQPQQPQDPFAPQQPQQPHEPLTARPERTESGPRPAGRFAADPFGTPAPRPAGAAADAPAPADPFAARRSPQDPFQNGPADPFAPGRPGGGPAEEPEDTQIGGFDPIRDEPQHGGAIPGGQVADPFGAGARPFGAAAAHDPFAATRNNGFAGTPYEPADPFGAPAPTPDGRPSGPAQPSGAAPAPAGPAASPAPAAAPSGKAAPKRRGKARKLLTLAVGGLLFAGAAAYGTGLMLNQADIPKGTTVLGTDIGGDSRDQAIKALDSSIAKAGKAPVELKIGGQSVALDPATAGLAFDTTATVDALTQHSYNPMDVIGSLAGGSKAVEPTVTVDRAKLKAALDGLATKSGQGLKEGYVRFTEAGQTEVVPGQAGQTLDSTAAAAQVEQAYRNRAAGLPASEIALTLTPAKPKVTEEALQAAATDLGKQVLAGRITLKAGTRSWDFGKLTASRALTLAPDASGKIVLTWDLAKLDAALNNVFDKSKMRKNGALVPITPQDVADGIATVVGKTSAKDRTYVFPA